MRLIDADAIIEKKWQAESEACFYALEDVVSVTDIEEAPTIEVSEDCISREWVLDKLNEKYKFNRFREHNDTANIGISQAESIVEDAPSVVPKDHSGETTEMVGEWIKVSADKYVQHAYHFYRCSECGEDTIGEPNYCPDCGAKMKGARMSDLKIGEILKEAIDKVRETRDVYVSIYIWENNVSISVYPYDEEEDEK